GRIGEVPGTLPTQIPRVTSQVYLPGSASNVRVPVPPDRGVSKHWPPALMSAPPVVLASMKHGAGGVVSTLKSNESIDVTPQAETTTVKVCGLPGSKRGPCCKLPC